MMQQIYMLEFISGWYYDDQISKLPTLIGYQGVVFARIDFLSVGKSS
jgi:hypothetical protein